MRQDWKDRTSLGQDDSQIQKEVLEKWAELLTSGNSKTNIRGYYQLATTPDEHYKYIYKIVRGDIPQLAGKKKAPKDVRNVAWFNIAPKMPSWALTEFLRQFAEGELDSQGFQDQCRMFIARMYIVHYILQKFRQLDRGYTKEFSEEGTTKEQIPTNFYLKVMGNEEFSF